MRIIKNGLFLFLLFIIGCGQEPPAAPVEESFTIAVIPDTQNYVDYTLQKSAGFALNGVDLFMAQMAHIAGKSVSNGGDIVFAASVGDVWQHVNSDYEAAHFDRGVSSAGTDRDFASLIRPQETQNFEIPAAIEGYRLLSAAGLPFGVAPGNHDYDAWWAATVPEATANDAPPQVEVHFGGFDNFRSAFGSDTEFFRDKDWYVSAYDGGSNSAQIFTAGSYRFLHLAFEMQAGDGVLRWAQQVIDSNSGLPTIISTHDFLNPQGERLPSNGANLAIVDPGFNNSSEAIWQKFISKNDQILLVLSGHQLGQALRIDDNANGHKVFQMLSDYQGRGQAALDAGQAHTENGGVTGLGDGWYRELTFFLGGDTPRVKVYTYSTHYQTYSSQLPQYAQWYRDQEQPEMNDMQFLQADEFTLELNDFYSRFGRAEKFSSQ